MKIDTRVLVGTALRDLAQLGAKIENYPRTTRGLAIRALERIKPDLQSGLHECLKTELRALGGGFVRGSKVEKSMVVVPGGQGRGASAFQARVLDDKAAIIAHAWDKGAVIRPKTVKYLAQPLSQENMLGNVSPRTYSKSEYSTWFYQKPAKIKVNPNVEMDSAGIMVIRSRRSYVLGKRKNSKTGKMETRAVPEVVARYHLLNEQRIRATNWIGKAYAKFQQTEFPKSARKMIEQIAAEQVTLKT